MPINPRFPAPLHGVRRYPGVRTLLNEALYVPSLACLRHVDVVHVFSASYWSFLLAPVPAMLAARSFGKRVILNYHSGEADDHLTHWGPLVHPWLRLVDDIVVPSAYLQDVFARHGYRGARHPECHRHRHSSCIASAILSVLISSRPAISSAITASTSSSVHSRS